MSKISRRRVLFLIWIITSLFIFTYSYGFVDFNLTLSSRPIVMQFVAWSQSLAMFNRPLSTQVFLGVVTSLFLFYFLTLRLKLKKFPWHAVSILAVIFALSYPFLSSDIFKYLFSGRMVVDYGLNPHLVPPNHIVGDDWLRFMRWIHTPSPYGPVMTMLGIISYVLGFGKFVPTLYLYKLAQIIWYLLAIFLIGKLVKKLSRSAKDSVFAQLFFALNPLIVLEWLVSAHNDAPMITLLLLSFYLLLTHKKALSLVSLLLSIGIKYITVIFLPFILLKKKFYPLFIIHYSLFILFLTPLLYKYSFQYQPWYVTWLIPLAALLPFSLIPQLVVAYSFGSLLRYLPFISTGLWGATPLQFALYSFAPPVIYLFLYLLTRRLRKL